MENETVEDLTARLDAMSKQIRTLRETNARLQTEIEELRQQNEQQDYRFGSLEESLQRLDERTTLLNLVESSDQLDGRQRSIVLIQHLRKKALRRQDRGDPPLAEIDRDGAEEALQFPDVDRTTIYDDMRRAARLVDNEAVVWYDATGSRARLRINLDRGDLQELTSTATANATSTATATVTDGGVHDN